MMKKAVFICLFFILSISTNAVARDIIGRVIWVADGDTITVDTPEKKRVRVRLYGIDCPESKQDFGKEAKRFVSDRVLKKNVTVRVMDTDRYGRTVGILHFDGRNLNEELLREGMAWYYGYHCRANFCRDWKQLEASARNNKIGLWSQPNPVNPSKIYSGNERSRVIHRRGCKNFNCKNCTVIFPTRSAAIAAGYRPCGKCKP